MKHSSFILSALLSILIVPSSYAQSVDITDRDYGSLAAVQPVVDALETAFDTLETTINEEIDGKFPKWDTAKASNATVLAGSGLDADYADVFSWGLLGGGVGVGADGKVFDLLKGDVDPDALPTASVAAGVLVGFNLGKVVKKKVGFFDFERMKVFASFFSFSKDLSAETAAITADTTHWSLRGQYKLFESRGPGLARWTGLAVTSGLTQTKMTFSVARDIEVPVDVSTPGNVIERFVYSAPISLSVNSSTFSIPVDFTTGAQLGYFLGIYAGVGFDISFGNSSLVLTDNDEGTIVAEGAQEDQVSAKAKLSVPANEAGPSIMGFRYLAGVSFDAQVIGLFAQFNGNASGQIGATAGARLYW